MQKLLAVSIFLLLIHNLPARNNQSLTPLNAVICNNQEVVTILLGLGRFP